MIACDAGNRIERGFEPKWADQPYDRSKGAFGITEEKNACKAARTRSDCAAFGIGGHRDWVLSPMKSYLETGSGLYIPPGGQG